MIDRRHVLMQCLKFGLATTTSSLWSGISAVRALAQTPATSYKAVVVIALVGGNDSNNLLIPLDDAEYQEYSSLRSTLAIPVSSIIPLPAGLGLPSFGLHPSLKNVAAMYTQRRAAIVANIGPLPRPLTKQLIMTNPALNTPSLLAHPAGQEQWESATAVAAPLTGWGGRIADLISQSSGSLPPVLNTSENSIFTFGTSVQGVTVQSGGAFPAPSAAMNDAILAIAQHDSSSTNRLVAATAAFRATSMQQQAVLTQAMTYAPIKQSFTSTPLGFSLQAVARLLAGRSVIGASSQLFYARQPGFDTHEDQLSIQSGLLSDFDANIGSFFAALDDLGLSDDVLVCTHSDFSRTLICNTKAGSDHGWGSHQLILGGGIKGGRIIGQFPALELGGPDDFNGEGTWIPTFSVSQLTAAIGEWLGLNSSQVAQVFPDLVRFPAGAIRLS